MKNELFQKKIADFSMSFSKKTKNKKKTRNQKIKNFFFILQLFSSSTLHVIETTAADASLFRKLTTGGTSG